MLRYTVPALIFYQQCPKSILAKEPEIGNYFVYIRKFS